MVSVQQTTTNMISYWSRSTSCTASLQALLTQQFPLLCALILHDLIKH